MWSVESVYAVTSNKGPVLRTDASNGVCFVNMEENTNPLSSYSAEYLLGAMLNIAPGAIIAVNRSQQILLFSRGAEEIFGYSQEEIVGQTLEVLLPMASIQTHQQHFQAFAQAPESVRLMNVRKKIEGRRKNGQVFPAEAAISKTLGEGERLFLVFLQDITERALIEKTLRKNRKYLENLMSARAAQAQLTEESLLLEIEAHLQAQEILLQKVDSLARSNADLTQFAAVVSHDLQEPLRMVMHSLELLAHEAYETQGAKEYVVSALHGATRMKTLIQNQLATARLPEQLAVAYTNCEEVLQWVQQNLILSIQENAVRITHEPLPTLLADKSQMIQLFQNLISNAIKFRSELPPEIHISARQLTADTLLKVHWVFCVRDNGLGIEPRDFERIFEMSQRLSPNGDAPGFGMGLTIARRVVERHGGRIWVESEPGKGAKFFFTLPEIKPEILGGSPDAENDLKG